MNANWPHSYHGTLTADERLQRVIEATNDGVWEYDLRTHRYSYLAPQAMHMLGAGQARQMLEDAAAARAVIHPEDVAQVVAAFKAHLLDGQPYDVEMRIRNETHAWLWVRSRGTVVRDPAGSLVCMVGAMSDINATRLANQALQRYQALMRTVLDVIPEPVLVKDSNLRLVMVNRAYAERAGNEVDNLIGRDTREFMPESEAERLVAADRAVLETGQDQVFEIRIANRHQHMVRSYIATKRLAHDADGQPIIVGTHHDVTDLKRSLAQFAAVIEDTPLVAVQGFGRDCKISHWNRASEELFGVTRSQAIGSRLPELILEPRLQHPFQSMVERVWSVRQAFGPHELQLRLRNGRRVWLLMTVFPVMQDGVVVETFSMAVDVTDRHVAEHKLAMHSERLQEMVGERTAELLRATQELKVALQAKSDFLTNMSHELRTPMHAILSFARLGFERVERSSPERLRDYYSRIVTSGERLLTLINDLLDLSKLEAGKVSVSLAPHDLTALVLEVAHEFSALVSEKKLVLQLPDAHQPCICDMDAPRMHQVVANLLSNAIKFSPPGSAITMSISSAPMPAGRRATDAGDQPGVLLSVSDCGVGLPEGEIESIFEKFVQSTKTQTGAGGTGLGLSICREIVLAHQGRISAHNRPQGGAVFEVLLPVHAELAAASQLKD